MAPAIPKIPSTEASLGSGWGKAGTSRATGAMGWAGTGAGAGTGTGAGADLKGYSGKRFRIGREVENHFKVCMYRTSLKSIGKK